MGTSLTGCRLMNQNRCAILLVWHMAHAQASRTVQTVDPRQQMTQTAEGALIENLAHDEHDCGKGEPARDDLVPGQQVKRGSLAQCPCPPPKPTSTDPSLLHYLICLHSKMKLVFHKSCVCICPLSSIHLPSTFLTSSWVSMYRDSSSHIGVAACSTHSGARCCSEIAPF